MLNTLTRPKKHGHGRKPRATPSKGFRPDIQGLRALAVLLVIADHLFGWPQGGFIGVDVFFVLSGFLITGLLIREHEKRGRISFANFYRRRARRILPLSLLVLAVTVAASWLIFSSGRALRITEDGVWSLLFGMNWHLALDGTDYMQADGVVSPLQHFWSLAVEEQFYVVWPWVLVLVLGVAAARLRLGQRQAMGLLFVTMALLTLGSFAFAMWETTASPTFAYFSTFSRAWELSAGALLAAAVPTMQKLPNVLRPVLAYLGLAGIVLGALLINSELPFPGPWAVVPVVSTVLVLAAGCGGSHAYLQPLTNPVSRYLGDISYSLYLWHFPVIILAGALIPLEGATTYALVLIGIVCLSAVSFYFLEEPIRHSSWLERKNSRRRSPIDTKRRLQHGAVIALVLAAVATNAAAFKHAAGTGPADVAPASLTPLQEATGAETSEPLEAVSAHQQAIQVALATPEWPELTPSVDQLTPETKVSEWIDDGCLGQNGSSFDDPIQNAQNCTFGDPSAPKKAVLIGDSVGISYAPALRAALEPAGYSLDIRTLQQCPAFNVAVTKFDGSAHPDCAPFREWALSSVLEEQPDLVILSSTGGALNRLESGASGQEALTEWQEGVAATFEYLSAYTGKIVVMDPPPGGRPLAECATRFSSPADCESSVSDGFKALATATRAAGAESVTFIDSVPLFCAPTGRCPAFIGSTPVYADSEHLTRDFAPTLAGELTAALTQ